MDTPPLVNEQIDAGAELVEKFDKYLPVSASFWVKLSDDSNWTLFIASAKLDGKKLGEAYGEILRLATSMQNAYIDPFQVKLISGTHPLTRSVMEVHQRYPGALPIRFNGPMLGGQGIDGAYLYPLQPPVAAS